MSTTVIDLLSAHLFSELQDHLGQLFDGCCQSTNVLAEVLAANLTGVRGDAQEPVPHFRGFHGWSVRPDWETF